MIWRAISEPSRSFVEANDSLHSSRPPAGIWPAVVLIRSSSSSSFPFSIVASSSRLKCVKIPVLTLAVNDSAGTNIPACIISCACPALGRNVDLPPWFAPVIMTTCLPSVSTSFPAARASSRLSARGASYRPRADSRTSPPSRDRGEDLIEVQVAEHRRVVTFAPVRGAVGQDAAERRYRIHSRLHQHVVRQKPSATAAVKGELHHPASI